MRSIAGCWGADFPRVDLTGSAQIEHSQALPLARPNLRTTWDRCVQSLPELHSSVYHGRMRTAVIATLILGCSQPPPAPQWCGDWHEQTKADTSYLVCDWHPCSQGELEGYGPDCWSAFPPRVDTGV